MELRFLPSGVVEMDHAKLLFPNFEGRGDKFNREGERNFTVIIPTQEMADELVANGWNVRVRQREDDEEAMYSMKVKVKFNGRGPHVYIENPNPDGDPIQLDEEDVKCLDKIDIIDVDMDIRPYDWETNGKTGRTAYLKNILVRQDFNRFANRHVNE